MSRSGYDDYDGDYNNILLINWRGAVTSAIRGKRGQAFLREMLDALDALPAKRLIKHELEVDGEVCAIGAVGLRRGIDMSKIDPNDRDHVAGEFGIAAAMAAEIMYYNDEAFSYWHNPANCGKWEEMPPEERFRHMRDWIVNQMEEAEKWKSRPRKNAQPSSES